MNVGRWAYGVGGTGLFILIGCAAPRVRLGDPQAEVAAMLARSAADWNAGDLGGFMSHQPRGPLPRHGTGGPAEDGGRPLYRPPPAPDFAPGENRGFPPLQEGRVGPPPAGP